MKRGQGVVKQLTYQFEVPSTDLRKDRYNKLLSNKKIRNFILREWKRGDNKFVLNGYITSYKPVLITTFKNWLDCTDNQLWPMYVSKEFLQSLENNDKTIMFKFNGIDQTPITNYTVEPIDYEDVPVDQSDSSNDSWEELVEENDIGPDGKVVKYTDITKDYMRKLIQKGYLINISEDDIEHYVSFCHRKKYNVNDWENFIWGAYAVIIRGDPMPFEIRDYNKFKDVF